MQGVVDGHADGHGDDDGLEDVELPAEQHQGGQRDDDDAGDGHDGVQANQGVQRGEERHQRHHRQRHAQRQRRAGDQAVLEVIEVEVADEPTKAHFFGSLEHLLRHPAVDARVEGLHALVVVRVTLHALELDDESGDVTVVEARARGVVGVVHPGCIGQVVHVVGEALQEDLLGEGEEGVVAAHLVGDVRAARPLHVALDEVLQEAVCQLHPVGVLVELGPPQPPAKLQHPHLRICRREVKIIVESESTFIFGVKVVPVICRMDAPHDGNGEIGGVVFIHHFKTKHTPQLKVVLL